MDQNSTTYLLNGPKEDSFKTLSRSTNSQRHTNTQPKERTPCDAPAQEKGNSRVANTDDARVNPDLAVNMSKSRNLILPGSRQ